MVDGAYLWEISFSILGMAFWYKKFGRGEYGAGSIRGADWNMLLYKHIITSLYTTIQAYNDTAYNTLL